jgi:DnaJ-domain-containing protein 1
MAWLAWFYRNHLKQFAAAGLGQEPVGGGARSHRQAGQDFSAEFKTAEAFDAYAVLGIPRSASSDSIQAAYRARMREYHPDKVAHLGEELQSLAHEKSQQIQRAYQELRR